MTAQTIALVAAALAFAASIIATGVALYNARLRKFTGERWWERQAEVYTRLIEALASMVHYHEEHLTAYEEGRNIPQQLQTETEEHWRRSYAELKKASAVGAFLVSRDAEAALRKLWRDRSKFVDPQDWYGELERDYVSARDCLAEITRCATRDLRTQGRKNWTSGWQFGRAIVASTVAIPILGLAFWAAWELREQRRWPFSTGTNQAAFLGTTFGMSPQEVRRSLARHSAVLMSRDEFGRIEPDRLFFDDFTPLYYDARSRVTLYMPGIEMFDSKVSADFTFVDQRLFSVSVDFDPSGIAGADEMVAVIDRMLRSTFQVPRRQESNDVSGAYTLHYSDDEWPSLWVNLTERDKPIVSLHLIDLAARESDRTAIGARQRAAFGVR